MYSQVPVAAGCQCQRRHVSHVGGGGALRPFYTGGTMAGPAITVRTRPGDNLMVYKALDIAEPGDIVVVDAQENPAVQGELAR
jgi:regulator of RNase E activity RraA